MANKALDFDGASGFVTVTDAAAIQNIFDGGGTVECWINVHSDGQTDNGRLLDKQAAAIGWRVMTPGELAGKVKLQFRQEFDNTDGDWRTSATEVTINTWAHIVVTYDNSNVANNAIIYVDGSPVALTQLSIPIGTRGTDVGKDLIIGNIAGDTATFDGTIDEVRLYKRILSQAEVTANYNGGAGRHWPSNLNDLVAWWHMDEGTGLYIFDGTSQGNTGTITDASWVDGFNFQIMKHVPRL